MRTGDEVTTVGAGATGTDAWRAVVGDGGGGTVPRWSAGAPGTASRIEAVAPETAAAVATLAAALGVAPATLLLAAHAVVLARLGGEAEVVTGVRDGPAVLPCRVDTAAAPTWGALAEHVARREADVRALAAVSPDGLAALRAGCGPWVETLLVARAREVTSPALDARDVTSPALPDGVVLAVEIDLVTVAVHHRTEVLDADAARRIASYHLAALRAMTADPRADPARAALLDAAELGFQIDGLAGPARALPDRRVHEIIEERVRARPDAPAAVRGDASWTYRELDDHADRIGRALLARGLGREDVVAVVTERTLGWLAAVLGVLKAGGVYLPVEPHFPPERIATVLDRSGCRLVVTEGGATGSLDAALADRAGITRLLVEDAWAETGAAARPGEGLGVAVAPDQLAYIFFTSGSTGLPKGAMCEHAGMLNHLLAKIDDMGVAEGVVVAQTAPQCFDISLWQLVSALLVGGTTLLVEQEAVLEVPTFLDTVVGGGVAVLQVVPSYLDVVLAFLEASPRDLGALACVAVTGEAVKKELVARWFAHAPHIPLVNAYGLTETCDDTNHAVMRAVPDRARVPLGPAIPNVRVYVVDEHLVPVPLGAPGEIVFSGVCVGRGYVNDPERTAAAFGLDPHRPGERLYRSGDRGRWLPGGELEFLGRRDAQVKVSGFRIELGEVENALLRVPGVRDGAVVVAGASDGARHLVGFHTGAAGHDALRAALGASLPGYMVPAVLHRRDALPLTANGKVDRKTLAALAAELGAATEVLDGPRTDTERRVAAVWAGVLGADAASFARSDDFFDRGGTSLSAVKVTLRLGRVLSLPEVVGHPVLADLAELLDLRSRE